MDIKKYWKGILIGIFILLATAGIIICAVLYLHSQQKPNVSIIASCNKTLYPTFCIESLTNSTDSDPKTQIQLTLLATNITLQRVNNALTALHEANADTILRSCVQLQEESVNLLEKSHKRIGEKPRNESDADVLTWLSAVLTNQDTCIDGLKGVDGEDGDWKKEVDEHLQEVMETASFCLTLFSNSVPDMNTDHGSTRRENSRKLLSSGSPVDDTGFPTWLNRKDRRLLTSSDPRSRADYVVAQDGSTKYETIASAINDVPRNSTKRTIIYIKAGRYEEDLNIEKDVENLMLVGEGYRKTLITGNKSVSGSKFEMYHTASFGISGSGFIACNLTFENRASPYNPNAVALRLSSDKSVIYSCNISGFQNTLYVHNQRQFFRESFIAGTVDIIFGNAAVVIQKCEIFVRNWPKVTITAQARQQTDQRTCITIQNSTIGYDFKHYNRSLPIVYYLGRPQKKFSRVMIIDSYIGDYINPEGWLMQCDDDDNDNDTEKTVYYGEYGNVGPGADLSKRVQWPGYHAFTSVEEVRPFGVDGLISGSSWLPATNVMFDTW